MAIEIVRVSSKGQVVIPKGIRKRAGIREDDQLIVYNNGSVVVMKKIRRGKVSSLPSQLH